MASSKTSASGSVDMTTLVITAAASAGAAYACSRLWAPGTLASAAATPVLVALLKELLSRPATVVTRAVPARGVVRDATHPAEPLEPVAERVAQQGEVPGPSRPGRRRAWQAAIVTGLLGFLVAAVIITVPELVAGNSASGNGRDTTLFGGHEKRSKDTPTETTTTRQRTVTAPQSKTVTVPPPVTKTTTAPSVTTTTPVPTTTTPAPQPPPAP
jgi:hypothetical protein